MTILTIFAFLLCFFIVCYIKYRSIEDGIRQYKSILLPIMIVFFISASIELYEILQYHLSGFHSINTNMTFDRITL